MPTLTIKGLPDQVYRRLKSRADANHRSLNGEIIHSLVQSVEAVPFDPEQWLAKAQAFRQGLEVTPLAESELRAARRSGRA